MAPNPRVVKAFRAMKAIGIPEEKTKPVLKRLLIVYERNWELIEQEDYRALADAIFDSYELEAAEQKKKLDDAEAAKKEKVEQAERMKAVEHETQTQEEHEKPLKRQRVRHRDDQAEPSCSSPSINSGGNLLKKPKLEVPHVLIMPDLGPDYSGELPVNTDAISPTENGFEESNHFISDETIDIAKGQESVVNTDATSPTDLLNSGNDSEKETENRCGENNHFIPDETIDMAKGHESVVKTDAISPTDSLKTGDDSEKETENRSEENNHFVSDETVDIAKGQESGVNTDAISPTDSLKTGNNFETETENGREENNHFIPDETVDIAKGQESVVNTDAISPSDSLKTGNDLEKETESGFEENNHFVPDEMIDIAKGEESVVISLVNEVNSECPPSFHYISRNAVFQNAYVNFSLACITKENCCSTCFGNCLTSLTPCPCAMQTGGEFAYTNEGTIKEDLLDDCIQTNRDPQKCHWSYCKECPLEKPKNEGVLGTCKGHLDKSFIKECWLKCGCNKKCGNRVVQRGIRYKLQVFMTHDGKGWGLRALEDLPKGAFVCEFVGEVLTCKEFYYRVSQSSKNDEYAYPVILDAEWGEQSEFQEDEALCLDAKSYGNVARFINHRCFDANLVEIPVEVENSDRHYYHLAFFTTRNVKALEELTRDYGIEFDDNDDPVKAFECQCGSRFCRNIKRSSGSRKRKCAQS